MPRISLHPTFIKDSLGIFRERGLKGLLFGTRAIVADDEHEIINDAPDILQQNKHLGARRGRLTKVDVIHKGSGTVYLIPSTDKRSSFLVLSGGTKITNGPDLWMYLSSSENPRNSLGNYVNLGLLKGNKGGQVYAIDQPLENLAQYKTAIVYCKQFAVLFSYAILK